MLWPGTLVGAGAGYAIASIPGAMLGALLGQALDRRLKIQSWAHLRERLGGRAAIPGDDLLFVLLGRLAKSEGRVVASHIHQARTEMRRLNLNEAEQLRAINAFKRGRDGADGLRSYLRGLQGQAELTEALLRACWRMAWADGKASRVERELIGMWGMWLGWSQQQVESLAGEHDPMRRAPISTGDDYKGAMALLGIKSDTDPLSIKRAYRRLLSRHHPDKIAGSGADARQVRVATEKTSALHNAYRVVKNRRGFT
ncbi:DnaJ-like protein DjlA [Pseudomonas tremae]|uniref:DnaJ-like protein DjlA n=2 Tax=Pseudomonas syringae group TaxID=136849 RepID=A0AA40NZW8_9PSED|nr:MULTISPECIES: TerB family tellurite resistance protein [Pseudomonas syringae group]KOP56022.1 molecular chaperone DnaJ [Pseudomonas coronafaciens pv. porri]KOP58473.1 molecular chaperone DnaJ [Pseudomonas coronafaciens pv. porri]KPY17696.1 DnaJ-like protein DjlA [Pseudomonas coronafaciens pv. porri]KPY91818.1 DnaJ-like protein DjlA [Pseudomonas tremae]RMN91872.1 DnaJ-like protein DjlA [Pseudomonas coronafaciens pv. coronafaciens]